MSLVPKGLLVFLCWCCLAIHASAITYTFTKIADSTGPFNHVGELPVINNSGEVAFFAQSTSNVLGIYKGSGGPVTLIDDMNGGYLNLGLLPWISDNGEVSFGGTLSNGNQGVFKGSGGPVTTIATTGTAFLSLDIQDRTTINSSGVVAFEAIDNSSVDGARMGSGGPTSTLADSTGPLSNFGGLVNLNDSGSAAFWTGLDVGGVGIFTSSGGPVTTIVDTNGTNGNFNTVGERISHNNAGTVAFTGELTSGVKGVFTGNGGPVSTLVDDTGPFSFFSVASINNNGDVAFFGSTSSSHGIYTGPNIVADKVIEKGDPLDGSSVVSLAASSGFYNDAGQVTFLAFLADNRLGVFRADPIPEPTSLTWAAIFASVLFRPWRRRKRSPACRGS